MKTILPNELKFQFADNVYSAQLKDWLYVIKRLLAQPLECREVIIWEWFDVVEQHIKLNAWETLHFEYRLDVELV